ncbi:MAG: hypothetical protein JXA30_12105, partial [Deltaproteobacteria bacterium]|nr:hypothetical protein [Deltaproteobacteria bacterium]
DSSGAHIRARFVSSWFRGTAVIAALFRGFRVIGSRRRWPEDGMSEDLFNLKRVWFSTTPSGLWLQQRSPAVGPHCGRGGSP